METSTDVKEAIEFYAANPKLDQLVDKVYDALIFFKGTRCWPDGECHGNFRCQAYNALVDAEGLDTTATSQALLSAAEAQVTQEGKFQLHYKDIKVLEKVEPLIEFLVAQMNDEIWEEEA